MKKFISIIMGLVMLLSFVGCQSEADTSSTEAVSGNPFMELEETDEYIFVLALQNIEFFNAHI